MSKVRQELLKMDAEVKQRRQEKEQKAQEQRQAEEQQRLMVQRQHQQFLSNYFAPALRAPSLPTPSIPFTPFPSLKNPLEEILDLTVHNTSPSSQVSTQTGLSVDNLTGPPEPSVDDYLEAFIQEQQQQQPQQESQATQESSTARDNDLFDMILSLNSFMTTPSQNDPASSTSDAPLSVPMVLSSSFSSSMPQFTPTPLTPSSSSSSLSQVSLPPTDQHMLPLPNSHCNSEATLNVREVLNSMLQSGTEPRYSVIQYQQPEWDAACGSLQ